MSNKILTVTLNPALDLTGELGQLNVGEVNLIDQSALVPAGKGINVAKVLSDLGLSITATGFLGAENSGLFEHRLQQMQVADEFVRVPGLTRTNVKLVDAQRATTDLNFPGFEVGESQLTAFEQRLFELAKDHEYVVVAGSLPKNVPAEVVAGWLGKLQQAGNKVLLDTSKSLLELGVEQRPWMIKPNEHELSELLGVKVETAEQAIEAGRQLADKGVANVLISMGEDGIVWVSQDKVLHARPPKVDVLSTVGAGDSAVAAFAYGAQQDWTAEEHIAFATAMGAMAVTQVNVGVADVAQLERFQQQVQIKRL